jgi:hypothetical protein
MSEEKYLMTITDLPEDDWIYVNRKGLISDLLESVIFTFTNKIRGSYKKITELTGFKKYFINKLHRKNRLKIKVHHLKILLALLPSKKQQMFIKKFESHVIKIGNKNSILYPKLPFNFNCKEGANFFGDLLTDGSLNSNFQVTYSNTNLNRIANNLFTVNKIFSNLKLVKSNRKNKLKVTEKLVRNFTKKSLIKCSFVKKIKKNRSGESMYYQLTYSNVIGKLLNKNLKIPNGRRIYSNPNTPTFILSSQELSKVFLGRVFPNEGHVESFGASICHSIDLTNIWNKFRFVDKKEFRKYLGKNRNLAPNLIWNYRKIFLLIGCKKPSFPYVTRIYQTKKHEIHVKWTIAVWGEDAKLVLEKIKLDNDFKSKLLQYVKSVNYFRISKKERLSRILEAGRNIQFEFGFFTTKLIVDELKLNRTTVEKHLCYAKNNDLVSIIKKDYNAYVYRVN